MRLLLDTHAWVWMDSEPERLGAQAAARIEAAEALHLSPVSTWEVLLLARKKRLRLDPDPQAWVERALRDTGATALPVTHAIARRSERLPGFHRQDPADRLLVATALEHDLVLVTADEWMRAWPQVKTLW